MACLKSLQFNSVPGKMIGGGVLSCLRSFSTNYGKTIGIKALSHSKCFTPVIQQSLLPVSSTVCPTFRYSSFRSSNPVEPIDQYPKVEIFTNPPEWQYVERILLNPLIPQPEVKTEYPSGWKPPNNKIDLPYYVARTKNHMIPVYLHRYYRGQRRITKLRKIQGDIWLLEKELHEVIEKKIGKKIATRVNELSGQIWFKDDFVTIISAYLMNKGL